MPEATGLPVSFIPFQRNSTAPAANTRSLASVRTSAPLTDHTCAVTVVRAGSEKRIEVSGLNGLGTMVTRSKASGKGPAAVTCPRLTGMMAGPLGSLDAIVMLHEGEPDVVGFAHTLMVVDWPGVRRRFVPDVLIENGALPQPVIELIDRLVGPLLVRVSVSHTVVLTGTLPKFTLEGLTARTGGSVQSHW